ncbi:MAG: Fe-Mn family superoxide dismutase [Humidesulfovibrio sp.]|uniref:Fe-Mn family superoxide dismutase n=1 Tax=Humidesulfovibrio sp. TaxID=2910988 RepID=UPI0027371812|nr:Fe-Mn family superoxide dismutase [Humidesulfovibrio sp.]MDP2846680.1 Fe-Mn family superoxide dismutase [Humidesulfovibrio sp.]
MSAPEDTQPGLDRREFLTLAGVAGVGLLAPTLFPLSEALAADPLETAALPYAMNALEPVISARTLEFHYGKHHAGYAANVKKMIPGSGLEGRSMEDIVRVTAVMPDKAALFNNAAQCYNHAFYWKCMKPGGGGMPTGKLMSAITASFGGYDAFRKAFLDGSVGRFGSGWGWLVQEGGKLKFVSTSNAETPLTHAAVTPLLVVDVWEHAYYLDYQNRRADYVGAFLDKLVNWDFVAANMK